MSHHGTILAHLIGGGFANRREDAATEGLSYLFNRSPAVRERFVELLRGVAPGLPTDLRFTAQHTVSGGRADMAGSSGGALRVLIENKFEAGLTDNQPLGYLESLLALAEQGEKLLLFIVPARRIEELWSRLLDRVRSSSMQHTGTGVRALAITGERGPIRLALTDWATVFSRLRGAGRDDAVGDLEQLRGLCQATEDSAWDPLEAAELSDGRFSRRMWQYLDIVRGSTDRAPPELLTLPRRSDSHGWGWSGRKFQFRDAPGGWLGVSFWCWRVKGLGPVWVHFDREHGERVDRCLRGWCEQSGCGFCESEVGASIHVELRAGCDRDQVIEHVIAQLREIRERLRAPVASP